ncbi:MAG: hypothetical protein AB1733_06280 [Thermodesulfobacteriota bacterium]
MAISTKGRERQWNNLAEEIESLESDPVAQALLYDLEQQDPERVGRLMTELQEQAMLED